jgi:hypothetical protein
MITETGYCIFPLCGDIEERDGFCISHAKYFAGPKPEKAKTKIAAKSEKRKADQKEYVKIVKAMLLENPNCEIREPGCQGKATGLHHKQKRGPKNFLLRVNLVRSCSSCNMWVELNSEKSLLSGLTVSRFQKAV